MFVDVLQQHCAYCTILMHYSAAEREELGAADDLRQGFCT